MRTSRHRHRVVIGMAVLLALGACDGGGKSGNGASGAGQTAAAADPADTKLNGYVKGYNTLIGTFGLPETAESYEANKIATRAATENISFTEGWIERAATELKEARGLPDGPAELDKAGDALIASLDSCSRV